MSALHLIVILQSLPSGDQYTMKHAKEIQKKFNKLVSELSPNGVLQHPNTLLHRAADMWPTRLALVCEDRAITFCALRDRVTYLAQKLVMDYELSIGNRVLILYENSIDFYIAYHAAWITGATVAPLNIFLTDQELQHIMADSQPKLIIASPSLGAKVMTQTAIPVICSDLISLTNEGEKLPLTFTPRSPTITDCTLLLYTSGTTGLPKGVMHSGESILTNSLQGISNFDITAQERLLAALPLFHSYMQNVAVWCSLILGALVIVVPRINRPALLQGIRHKPTIIAGIPQLFGLLCLMKNLNLSKLRFFITGGDALNATIKLGFELLFNRRIINGYGLTETAPFIAANLDEGHAPIHCVGRPFEGIAISIRLDNEPVEQGAIGTIWVKGKNVMLGYHNATEATAAVLRDGWFNTGDLGYLDSAGKLVLAGRAKDLIVHNGMKIYPQEIENLLTQHPNVLMAAVIGITQGKTEFPVAFVVLSSPLANAAVALKEYCRIHLAIYKIPQTIYFREKLPQTATGKIDKKVLRSEIAREILE